jgi:hypothetical protein
MSKAKFCFIVPPFAFLFPLTTVQRSLLAFDENV